MEDNEIDTNVTNVKISDCVGTEEICPNCNSPLYLRKINKKNKPRSRICLACGSKWTVWNTEWDIITQDNIIMGLDIDIEESKGLNSCSVKIEL